MTADGVKTTYKAAFLDRDGTINVDRNYLRRVEDFEYLDGAVEGLRALSEQGYLLVVITNQSGIARGYFTEEDYLRLDGWMKADLLKRGVRIAGSYCCPHLPEGSVPEYARECDCRKPKTGLYLKAARELSIDLDRSIAIGDKERDLAICLESGARGFLLSDDHKAQGWYEVCRDWKEIIQKVRAIQEPAEAFQ